MQDLIYEDQYAIMELNTVYSSLISADGEQNELLEAARTKVQEEVTQIDVTGKKREVYKEMSSLYERLALEERGEPQRHVLEESERPQQLNIKD